MQTHQKGSNPREMFQSRKSTSHMVQQRAYLAARPHQKERSWCFSLVASMDTSARYFSSIGRIRLKTVLKSKSTYQRARNTMNRWEFDILVLLDVIISNHLLINVLIQVVFYFTRVNQIFY